MLMTSEKKKPKKCYQYFEQYHSITHHYLFYFNINMFDNCTAKKITASCSFSQKKKIVMNGA